MSDPNLVAEETRALLDSQFNRIIIEGLAMGLYTVIFVLAIWRLHRKANRKFYAIALSILWVGVMIDFAVDWVTVRHAFVISNDSPVDMINGSSLPHSLAILEAVAGVFILTCSDGILIWRCHLMWNNKFVLGGLVLLLLAADGFMISNGIVWQGPTALLDATIGALCTALCTIGATTLIAIKIIMTASNTSIPFSYNRVIALLVQSAALVSLVNLAVVVLQFVDYFRPFDLGSSSGRIALEVGVYLGTLQGPVTGLAPTLIAFRVDEGASLTEIDSSDRTRTSTLPRITFRRQARGTTSDAFISQSCGSDLGLGMAHADEEGAKWQGGSDIEAEGNQPSEQEKKKQSLDTPVYLDKTKFV